MGTDPTGYPGKPPEKPQPATKRVPRLDPAPHVTIPLADRPMGTLVPHQPQPDDL